MGRVAIFSKLKIERPSVTLKIFSLFFQDPNSTGHSSVGVATP